MVSISIDFETIGLERDRRDNEIRRKSPIAAFRCPMIKYRDLNIFTCLWMKTKHDSVRGRNLEREENVHTDRKIKRNETESRCFVVECEKSRNDSDRGSTSRFRHASRDGTGGEGSGEGTEPRGKAAFAFSINYLDRGGAA